MNKWTKENPARPLDICFRQTSNDWRKAKITGEAASEKLMIFASCVARLRSRDQSVTGSKCYLHNNM
jgi:hypothetical protein